MNPVTQVPRGFAFVTYESAEEAETGGPPPSPSPPCHRRASLRSAQALLVFLLQREMPSTMRSSRVPLSGSVLLILPSPILPLAPQAAGVATPQRLVFCSFLFERAILLTVQHARTTWHMNHTQFGRGWGRGFSPFGWGRGFNPAFAGFMGRGYVVGRGPVMSSSDYYGTQPLSPSAPPSSSLFASRSRLRSPNSLV